MDGENRASKSTGNSSVTERSRYWSELPTEARHRGQPPRHPNKALSRLATVCASGCTKAPCWSKTVFGPLSAGIDERRFSQATGKCLPGLLLLDGDGSITLMSPTGCSEQKCSANSNWIGGEMSPPSLQKLWTGPEMCPCTISGARKGLSYENCNFAYFHEIQKFEVLKYSRTPAISCAQLRK